MEAEGKLVTCNRCGATTFLKFLGDVDTDGGYSSYRKHEELPEGWIYGTFPKYVHLCPACHKLVDDFYEDFYQKKEGN